MIVYQLMLYSCISVNFYDGDLMSTTCRWDARAHYATEQKCKSEGIAAIGTAVFSDFAEARFVSKTKCWPVGVTE